MLLLVFCAEIAAGVLAFLYRDKVKMINSFLILFFLIIVSLLILVCISIQIYEEITIESKQVIANKYGTGIVEIDYAVNLMQQEVFILFLFFFVCLFVIDFIYSN